jgi:hypothetical protein
MGRVHKDLSGNRFGTLTLVLKLSDKEKNGSYKYIVQCDCGESKVIGYSQLANGRAKSCGCEQYLTGEKSANYKHGQSYSAKYRTHYTRLNQLSRQQQTPKWADLEKIKQFYLNRPTGFHVDHIIPIKGKSVSGLHVENNLQYLPADENMKKLNKFQIL